MIGLIGLTNCDLVFFDFVEPDFSLEPVQQIALTLYAVVKRMQYPAPRRAREASVKTGNL